MIPPPECWLSHPLPSQSSHVEHGWNCKISRPKKVHLFIFPKVVIVNNSIGDEIYSLASPWRLQDKKLLPHTSLSGESTWCKIGNFDASVKRESKSTCHGLPCICALTGHSWQLLNTSNYNVFFSMSDNTQGFRELQVLVLAGQKNFTCTDNARAIYKMSVLLLPVFLLSLHLTISSVIFSQI